jgi:hypothetical protein
MQDFKLLKFLDRFQKLFQAMDINYAVMRKILQLKLTMDGRRATTIGRTYSKNKEGNNNFRNSLFWYVFFGGFLSIILIPNTIPAFYSMSIIFGCVMFFITLIMLSDFSSVLLDIRDKNIILSRGVDSTTFNAAKFIHIIFYLLSIVMAFTIIPMVVALARHGIVFFLLFLLETTLMTIFIIFLTSIIYYIILSFFDGEKLKDIINYVQIVFSIIIILAQQLMPRLFNFLDFKIVFTPKWWCYLLPSMWMAAPFSIIEDGISSPSYIYLALCSIFIPLLVFILYSKYMAPFFEMKLYKMANSNGSKKTSFMKKHLQAKLINLICHDKEEKAFLKFVLNMLSTERRLKLELYPNLTLFFIIPFIFMLNHAIDAKSISQFFVKVSNGSSYLGLYMTATIASITILSINRSECYKAAWIYKAIPLKTPAPILKASLKATLIKYSIPIFIIQALIFIALCGLRILPGLIVIFLNLLFITTIIFSLSKKTLPFSQEFGPVKDNNTGSAMLSLLVTGIFALIHFFVKNLKYGIVIYGAVILILLILRWKTLFKTTWKEIIQ